MRVLSECCWSHKRAEQGRSCEGSVELERRQETSQKVCRKRHDYSLLAVVQERHDVEGECSVCGRPYVGNGYEESQLRMHRKGLIELPPPRSSGYGKARPKSRTDLSQTDWTTTLLELPATLPEVRPLKFEMIQAGPVPFNTPRFLRIRELIHRRDVPSDWTPHPEQPTPDLCL